MKWGIFVTPPLLIDFFFSPDKTKNGLIYHQDQAKGYLGVN